VSSPDISVWCKVTDYDDRFRRKAPDVAPMPAPATASAPSSVPAPADAQAPAPVSAPSPAPTSAVPTAKAVTTQAASGRGSQSSPVPLPAKGRRGRPAKVKWYHPKDGVISAKYVRYPCVTFTADAFLYV
jgi:hypothetical protein